MNPAINASQIIQAWGIGDMIFDNPVTTFLVLFLLPGSFGLAFAYFIRKKKPQWKQPFLWASLGFVTCMLLRHALEFIFRGP